MRTILNPARPKLLAHVPTQEWIDELHLRNRAYQVLYALGESSTTVTLQPGEAQMWIDVAQSVVDGDRSTEARRHLAATLNPTMLRYITTGSMR